MSSKVHSRLLHNLEGYDSHLFVKSLGYNTNENIKCIPKMDEKYISFSKSVPAGEIHVGEDGEEYQDTIELRFLNSLKFTQSSLDKLAGNLREDQFKTLEKEMGTKNIELLKRKGVFPYEFMTGFDKLQYSRLPAKSEFHSKLNNMDIGDEDYAHAKKVWDAFECRTMRDYHDLYLKMDVLLLTDIMENVREICISNYGLDPMWYYTVPGLAWM